MGLKNMWKDQKEYLIPPGKSNRIIYLEPRGRKHRRISMGSVCFALLAVLCMLYCLSILLFMGYGTKFFLIWAVLSIVFALVAILLSKPGILQCLPGWLKKTVTLSFLAGFLLFVIIEGMICSRFSAQAAPGADYVIILGAQWKTQGPSYVLQKRLDKAIEYLNENPDTYVIVSGGQGSNEPISEALGMSGYLQQRGISEERIFMEDTSTNTYENLMNSSVFLNREKDKVVLVTNNFHVFRGEKIAQKQGYVNVEGLAAESYPAMVPNNLLREFFGVIKDFVIGNI